MKSARMRILVLVLLICVIGLAVYLGLSESPRAREARSLASWCKLIKQTRDSTYQEPPLTSPELVAWLRKSGVLGVGLPEEKTLLQTVDARTNAILDLWGNPIVLVGYDGKLGELGSRGPDGEWALGDRDDILVRLEDGKVRERIKWRWPEHTMRQRK